MFPVFFPGVFTFVTSYLKLIILSALVAFVSYHYVVVTRYEKKFDQMKADLQSCELDRDNWKKKGFFSQDTIDNITKYYEHELNKCKAKLKKDGELNNEEILHQPKTK
jgi:hypothetical protein